jgi:oligoribonuclease NrnB/cAMP/cGMP phosphodiesterase (DHH superfamily)
LKVGVMVAPVYWKNEVSQRILDRGFDMAVIVDVPGSMVSLRSGPGGPDCSMIAGRYGGGGHPRAAGFKIAQFAVIDSMFNEVFG